MRLPLAAARTWGGARKGAGRKPRGRPSMPHATRPKIDPRCPVQVTIRATPGLPSLRSARVFGALRRAIARASVDRFRVIHFSIQQDHGHFIVEGDEARRARGGVHGLAIRLALAVNRALGRRGKVVGDRYHARPLTTPRQMRTSMVYVLLNFRKHLRAPACIDPRSSGPHFSGWHRAPAATDVAPATALPRPGWRASAGSARAGRCGWKNTRPPAATAPNLISRMFHQPAGSPRRQQAKGDGGQSVASSSNPRECGVKSSGLRGQWIPLSRMSFPSRRAASRTWRGGSAPRHTSAGLAHRTLEFSSKSLSLLQ